MAHLSFNERKLYSEVFLDMDKDGNGWLSLEELTQGCRRLGFALTNQDAKAAFSAIDANNDDRITLDEFLAIMGHIENNSEAKRKAKLRKIFCDMDKNGDGLLTEKELMDGLRDSGYSVSKDQVRKVIQDLDMDRNEKLDFEEFIRMFKM